MRAPPGSESGGRSTIAEYGTRSLGVRGTVTYRHPRESGRSPG
jgi:hypothetical protein